MLVESAPRAIPTRSFAGLAPLSTRALQHALDRRRFFERAIPEEIIRADERELRNRLWALGGSVGGSWGGRMATYAATFRPDKVAGCLRYGFVESASDAASYPDRTGNGHNFVQDTPSERPMFDAEGLNGRPALVFDGIDDYLLCTTSLAQAVAGGEDTPCTIVLVVLPGTPGANCYYAACGNSSNALPVHGLVSSAAEGSRWSMQRRGDSGGNTFRESSTETLTQTPQCVMFISHGTTGSIRANGVELSFNNNSLDTGEATFDRAALGALVRVAVAGHAAMTLAADAFYARAITDDECQYLERGYAARYGLTLSP